MLNDFGYLEKIIANLEKVKQEQGENGSADGRRHSKR